MARGGVSDGANPSSGRAVSMLFFASFVAILLACLLAVGVVHVYWTRLRNRLRVEHELREARDVMMNDPWAVREGHVARRAREDGTGSNGSNRGGSAKDGSVIRGYMFGVFVLNPSGSFSFGSSKVVTNELEVKARQTKARETEAAIVFAALEARARLTAMGTEMASVSHDFRETTYSHGHLTVNVGASPTETAQSPLRDPWAPDNDSQTPTSALFGTSEGWEPGGVTTPDTRDASVGSHSEDSRTL
jgi:hypothetical protein